MRVESRLLIVELGANLLRMRVAEPVALRRSGADGGVEHFRRPLLVQEELGPLPPRKDFRPARAVVDVRGVGRRGVALEVPLAKQVVRSGHRGPTDEVLRVDGAAV